MIMLMNRHALPLAVVVCFLLNISLYYMLTKTYGRDILSVWHKTENKNFTDVSLTSCLLHMHDLFKLYNCVLSPKHMYYELDVQSSLKFVFCILICIVRIDFWISFTLN